MTEERRNEISYMLIKKLFSGKLFKEIIEKKEVFLLDLIGNMVPEDEVRQFYRLNVRDIKTMG